MNFHIELVEVKIRYKKWSCHLNIIQKYINIQDMI